MKQCMCHGNHDTIEQPKAPSDDTLIEGSYQWAYRQWLRKRIAHSEDVYPDRASTFSEAYIMAIRYVLDELTEEAATQEHGEQLHPLINRLRGLI